MTEPIAEFEDDAIHSEIEQMFNRIIRGAVKHQEQVFSTWPFAPWRPIPGATHPAEDEDA